MTSLPQDQSGELRILHWNIHSWRDDAGTPNVEAVVDLIRRTDPHVVSLVEVDESWGQPSVLDEVANRCGYFSVFVPAFEFGQDAPGGGFGNALLSRLSILAVRQRQLLWPPRIFDGSEPSEARSVVFAKLRAASASVWIGSTHLPRGVAAARVNAARRVAAMARTLDGQWLVVGDFNMPADSWLDEHPSLHAYPEPPEPTHPAEDAVEPIDYCIAPQELRIQARALPEKGSDHLPILVRCAPGRH